MSGSIFISHDSALAYWRSNPPWYVLEGGDRNLRSLRSCARTLEEFESFVIPESEFGPEPIHILVPASNPPRCPERFKAHKQTLKLPPHALYPLWDGVFVVSPELCFVQMCKSLSFEEALELGMELCGVYSLRQDGDSLPQRDYALIDIDTFRRHLASWSDMKGIQTARVASKYLAAGSASPMETKLFLLLCLPLQYGGYNLGRPELNVEIDLQPEEMEILKRTKIKPDLLWRQQKLIVEYDGSQHEEAEQSAYDAKRTTVLEARGYTVHRIGRHQIFDPLAFDSFASSLASLLGVRRRPVTLKQQYARENLHAALLQRTWFPQ